MVDSNVVVKFLVKEPDHEKAELLLNALRSGRIRLLAPDFLFIECLNALWVKTRRGELTRAEAEGKVRELANFCALMELVPAPALADETFRIAVDSGQAVYDSAFVALADLRSAVLITADVPFFERMRGRARLVRLLSSLQPAN